MFIVRMIYIH